MDSAARICSAILPLGYLLTLVAYGAVFVYSGRKGSLPARILLVMTIALHLTYLTLRTWAQGHIPLGTQSEALSFFAAAMALVYLYLETRMNTQAMGIILLPVVLLFQLLSSLRYPSFAPMKPILVSPYFAFHAGTSTLAFAAFAVGALLSILYLLLLREIRSRRPGYVFQRIPSLEALDTMAYKAITLGFLLLTAGIASGSIWADKAWGSFWSWDPKQVSSLVVWIVYAAYLHARLQRGWEGKRVAIFATLGFATLVFTFVFVDLLFHTVHRFL